MRLVDVAESGSIESAWRAATGAVEGWVVPGETLVARTGEGEGTGGDFGSVNAEEESDRVVLFFGVFWIGQYGDRVRRVTGCWRFESEVA